MKRSIKKIEKAIDALIDVQDNGDGCEAVSRALDILNSLLHKMMANDGRA